MSRLIFQKLSRSPRIPTRRYFKLWTVAVLADQKVEQTLLIRVVDRLEIIQLNERYRGKQGVTNVLSFPFQPLLVDDVRAESKFLGEVILCAPVINLEARQLNQHYLNYWAHLVIHGTLHLLGFDHETLAKARVMERLEAVYLRRLGYSVDFF